MPNFYFYTITFGFVGGVLLRSFFEFEFAEVIFLLLLSFTCALVWKIRNEMFRAPLFITSLMLFGLALGVLRLDVSEQKVSILDAQVETQNTFEGIVVREPDIREKNMQLYVKEEETGTVILVRTDRFTEVVYGDRISWRGVLMFPEPFMTDTGREFKYPEYLKAHGVRHVMSNAIVTMEAHGEGNRLLSILFEAKKALMNALEEAVPEPSASLGEGLTLGVKQALGEDLEAVFREVGLIHIVVLSGYNIMIVVEYLMKFLGAFFRPRMRMFLGVVAIMLFALLVGLSATVVRASIMAALVLIARGTGRTYVIVRALMLACVVMLLINPYLLVFDPGFQLSFLATLGLIVLAPRFELLLHRVPEKFGFREVLGATLAAQLFVLPFILYQMGTLSLISIFANVLVLPLVPFAMLLVAITGFVGLVSSTLALIPGFFAHGVLGYIIMVAKAGAAVPFASFTISAFPFWGVIVLYLCLLVFVLSLRSSEEIEGEEQKPVLEKGLFDDWDIEEESEVKLGAGGDANGRELRSRPPEHTFPFR